MASNVLAFPSEMVRDPYVKFKADPVEAERFNDLLDKVTDIISSTYPDADFDNNSYAFMAESILAMVMRSKGIDHPLNVMADSIGSEFAKEYI